MHGEAYASLLRRARTLWNRSIRSKLNMCAYEATARGAVLLMETDNLEVREVFEDGVSYVLYDDRTLESRVESCLARPGNVARMAGAGWRRVQTETYGDHLTTLLVHATTLGRGE